MYKLLFLAAASVWSWAAPAQSVCTEYMPAAGLIESPPESNVTPFPARATAPVGGSAPGSLDPEYQSSTSTGGWSDP